MNNWSITGNLGQDPRLRVTPTGTAVLNLNVALRVRTKGQDGKWADETEWVDVTMFGARCEWLSQNLHKGMRIGASGEMRIRRYVSKTGEPKVQVELIAHDIEPLDRRPGADDAPRTSRPMGQGQGGRPQHRDVPAYGPPQGRSGPQYGGAAGGHRGGYGGTPDEQGFDPDDDIPF